jgi:hypothetical protein
MKAIATILWFCGMVCLGVVASQNGSSTPARVSGPSWIHAHF